MVWCPKSMYVIPIYKHESWLSNIPIFCLIFIGPYICQNTCKVLLIKFEVRCFAANCYVLCCFCIYRYTATYTVDTLRVCVYLRFADVTTLPAIFCFQYSCNSCKNIYLTLFIHEAVVFLLLRPPETT